MREYGLRRMRCVLLSGLLMGLVMTAAAMAETAGVATMVSLQGSAEVRRTRSAEWQPAKIDTVFFPGDMLRIHENGRAAVQLQNDALLRLDQGTTLTFTGIEREETYIIELLKGAAHFFSRGTRSLKVVTPFVNASVEGTEFQVHVTDTGADVSMFQGRVRLENDQGAASLGKGESAVVRAGAAPEARLMVSPRDAVKWTLYYPEVVAVEDLSVGKPSPSVRLIQSAAANLAVGQATDAEREIDAALSAAPGNGEALSLKAVVAVATNRKEEALALAQKAVEKTPGLAAAHIALSYARQAAFDLKGAQAALEDGVGAEPDSALAWARLSEIRLALGDMEGALEAARRSTGLRPDLALTRTVMGFAYLAKADTKAAAGEFEWAIALDTAMPLPRLGLGLARIRDGKLREGRRLLELAAGLDPGNSIYRSYLGKAYFEEKRDKFAADQLSMAKELDPQDPTPWFYDAIRKQSINRPVEALHDLQTSIALNDNRAVYRSSLHLDEDLAARNVALAQIYKEIGFDQLALSEGYKSLGQSPQNHSAHRFLSDIYASLPRHEIARVSEQLQAQLLQPINLTPVSPQLSESSLFVHRGVGPSPTFLDSYDTLFHRDGLKFQVNTVTGGNDTLGGNTLFSGVFGKASFSLGQYYYDTDGFRENNDLEQEIYNGFVQYAVSHKTSLQAEVRYSDVEKGDLPLRFDPENYLASIRNVGRDKSVRFGFMHKFDVDSTLIGTVVVGEKETNFSIDEVIPFGPMGVDMDFLNVYKDKGVGTELQYLLQGESCRFVAGGGYYFTKNDERTKLNFNPEIPMVFVGSEGAGSTETNHGRFYLYATFDNIERLSFLVGASVDYFNNGIFGELSSFNPKMGMQWKLSPRTTLRGAVFRTFRGNAISEQTIEPTQVMGFSQLYDDRMSDKVWKYGIGVDHEFSDALFGGAELSARDVEAAYVSLSGGKEVFRLDEDERDFRCYMSWAATPFITLTAEFLREALYNNELASSDELRKVETSRFPISVSLHHPIGLSSLIKASYVSQEGIFGNDTYGFVDGSDSFWIIDADVNFLLPKRYGRVSLLAKNLFDEDIGFQDTDPANSDIYPERMILVKLSVVF